MNNKIKQLMFIFSMMLSIVALAADSDEEVRLRQQYQAPEELARLLDEAYEHDQEFRTCIKEPYCPCRCPRNMACYIKKNCVLERLKGWENAHQILKDKNINEVLLPQKYLWRDFLVAEELRPESNTLDGITKDQLAQLLVLAKAGCFSDFVGGKRVFGTNNVFFTKDRPRQQFWKPDVTAAEAHERKIAIIDTKYFYFNGFVPDEHNLWRLFSRKNDDECNDGSMRIANDVDMLYRPNDFESFWQKYHECFQSHNHGQN